MLTRRSFAFVHDGPVALGWPVRSPNVESWAAGIPRVREQGGLRRLWPCLRPVRTSGVTVVSVTASIVPGQAVSFW